MTRIHVHIDRLVVDERLATDGDALARAIRAAVAERLNGGAVGIGGDQYVSTRRVSIEAAVGESERRLGRNIGVAISTVLTGGGGP